jgi:hypothetical protein
VHRRRVQGVPVGQLHDLAEVHHGDAVGDVADHREVVRDDHVRQAELVLEVVHQVDDLRLDGHVERGDRLVGDDHTGLEGERAGDADALTLAAGELVRVAVVVLRAQAHQLQKTLDLLLHPALGLDALELERRRDDGADGVPGVQRAVRVLEDHLDVAAQRSHAGGLEVRDVRAVELDLAAGRLQQAGDEPAHGRLAAAGLPDDAEGLAPPHLEVDAVDGLDRPDLPLEQALLDGEVLDQALDPEQRFLVVGARGRHGGPGLSLAHSFGAISSVQIRVRSSCDRWQAVKCRPPTSRSSGRSVRVTLSLGTSA